MLLKSWFDDRSAKRAKKEFSAIRQHLFNNYEFMRNYKKDNFLVLMRAKDSFQLHILQAI